MQHYTSLQWEANKKHPSKVHAVADPYLLGSCIAGESLELLDVSASETSVSVKEGKRVKGVTSTAETQSFKFLEKWDWKTISKQRWERERADQLGNEKRH